MDDSYLDKAAHQLATSLPGTDPVSAELLRLLAEGAPVPVERLAVALDRPKTQVAITLWRMASVEFDEAGRVVGCGITLRPTPHRMLVDGRELYTWCAFDTLLYPPMLAVTAEVESPCAASGAPIRLTVTPRGVEALEPAEAVMSLVVPEGEVACCDVRGSFCSHVHFFISAILTEKWLEEHPGGAILPVAEAFDLGRRVREHCQEVVR